MEKKVVIRPGDGLLYSANDGSRIELPKYLYDSEKRIEKTRKALGRKQDGSNACAAEEAKLKEERESARKSVDIFVRTAANEVLSKGLPVEAIGPKRTLAKDPVREAAWKRFLVVLKKKAQTADADVTIRANAWKSKAYEEGRRYKAPKNGSAAKGKTKAAKKPGRAGSRSTPPLDGVNVVRYTYDAWIASYPGSTVEEWESVTVPWSAAQFVAESVEKLGEAGRDAFRLKDGATARVVALDEEYFEWLRKNGRENDSEARLKYAEEVSDADADRLLRKNKFGLEVEIGFLRIFCLKTDGNVGTRRISLDETTREALKSYLPLFYGDGAVEAPGFVMKPDDAYAAYADLLDCAERWARGEAYGGDRRWLRQKSAIGVTLATYCVPFFLKRERSSASFLASDPFADVPDEILDPSVVAFDRKSLDEDGYEGVPEIADSEGGKALVETFLNDGFAFAAIEPLAYAEDQLPESEERLTEALREAAEEENVDFRLVRPTH